MCFWREFLPVGLVGLCFFMASSMCAHADDALANKFLQEAPQKWKEYESLLHGFEQQEEKTTEYIPKSKVKHDIVHTTCGNKESQVLLHLRREGKREHIYGANPDYEFKLKKGQEDKSTLSISDVRSRMPQSKGYALRNRWFFVRSIWYAFPLDFLKVVSSPGFHVKDATETTRNGNHIVQIEFEYQVTKPGPKEKTLPKAYVGTLTLAPDLYWAIMNLKMEFDDPIKEVGAIEMENTIDKMLRDLPVVTATTYRWYDPAGKLWKRSVSKYIWKEFSGDDDTFTLSAFGFPEPTVPQLSRSRLWFFCIGVVLLVFCATLYVYRRHQCCQRS